MLSALKRLFKQHNLQNDGFRNELTFESEQRRRFVIASTLAVLTILSTALINNERALFLPVDKGQTATAFAAFTYKTYGKPKVPSQPPVAFGVRVPPPGTPDQPPVAFGVRVPNPPGFPAPPTYPMGGLDPVTPTGFSPLEPTGLGPFDPGGLSPFPPNGSQNPPFNPGIGGPSPGIGNVFPDPASPVPEPETWAMIILGLGCVGIALWRKRRQEALMPN
ncbi:PEPxxWA-CTERM sorting domain-containing protein [Sphingobium phenoxybenzoativorans]|uniref:PEPxxWA-CTERM sorting domain-containing protein n=1 Tax=Sphingobium phenoxybenzoativorans TaxID=1592790 RepID=A0A975K6E4_9SPHN|nr:PEPxxWA-CTERM sorting domain-containing protein [Sphingobium phenoxybenzoativorans]QUT05646.1 PEPxxWA-CTERM sorting domain-containing protein [Sphingobium phenoxybenzoativorans]